ncbi:MAG TPA: hypothetical protein VGC88_03000 [Terriglobales bacterium]|jgi:hypothetical protein
MTEQDLISARQRRFRTAGNSITTIEDARAFMNDVSFCLMYPLRHAFAAPLATFIGAFVGSADALPFAHIAFADPRTKDATELMVRMLREKSAFESNFFEESPLLISSEMFPYFYALVADKTPRIAPKTTGHYKVSRLAVDVYAAIEKHGPLTKSQLHGEYLARGGSITDAGLDRALNELWAILKITRVDHSPEEGARWGLLAQWAPDLVRRGAQMSAPEATSAIISRYLAGVIAAEEGEIEEFVGRFASRSRVLEILKMLIAAREIEQVSMPGTRGLLKMADVAPAAVWSSPAPAERRPKPQSRKTHNRLQEAVPRKKHG